MSDSTPARYQEWWHSLPWNRWCEEDFDLYLAASCVKDRMWLIERMDEIGIGLPVMEDPQYRLSLKWLHELMERYQ